MIINSLDQLNQISLKIITRIKKETEGANTLYRFSVSRHNVVRPKYALKRYEDSTSTYTMFPLVGATQTEKSIKELLDVMIPGTGLANTLVDKDAITFRYVIDLSLIHI